LEIPPFDQRSSAIGEPRKAPKYNPYNIEKYLVPGLTGGDDGKILGFSIADFESGFGLGLVGDSWPRKTTSIT
jgi:hypothetical protein